MLKEGDNTGVIEIPVADMVADLDAAMTASKAAFDLRTRCVCVLQRNLAERPQPIRLRCTDLERQIIEDASDAGRLIPGVRVGKKGRGRRHRLDRNAVLVHIA